MFTRSNQDFKVNYIQNLTHLEVAVNIVEYIALSERDQEELFKRLLHKTIKDAVLGVKETAYKMGLPVSTLYKWGSTASNKIPKPWQLAHLMHIKKNLSILYFLNELFTLIPFPCPRCLDTLEDIGWHVIQVFKETSSACQAVSDLLEPGSPGGVEITAERFTEIHQKINAAHQQLAAFEEAARMKAQKGVERIAG